MYISQLHKEDREKRQKTYNWKSNCHFPISSQWEEQEQGICRYLSLITWVVLFHILTIFKSDGKRYWFPPCYISFFLLNGATWHFFAWPLPRNHWWCHWYWPLHHVGIRITTEYIYIKEKKTDQAHFLSMQDAPENPTWWPKKKTYTYRHMHKLTERKKIGVTKWNHSQVLALCYVGIPSQLTRLLMWHQES